ncbi:MAG TPA: hypothetical protein VK850_12040 [Candidatus Binatia bacterium]|nr:hypothetical protein [Candidatus Binatia bacterium]
MQVMASGGRLRKVIVTGVLIIGCLGLLGLIFHEPLSVGYHKHRLVVAKARHWRLTTQGYSFWDHVTEIVRGRPVSAEQVIATWKKHEEALVQRGFLKRQVFVAKDGVLPSRSSYPAYNEALARMEATCPWWSATRVETNLIVTACKKGLADWQPLALKAGLLPKSDLAQSTETSNKRCSRKRKKSDETETWTGSLAAGYLADDVFGRAFMRRSSPAAAAHQP